jgi:pimeloyl-ACP methyl ester carboxylesterase
MIRERWLGDAFRPELLPLALANFDTSDPEQVRAHLPRAQHLQIARALWEYDPLPDYASLTMPVTGIVAGNGTGSEDAAQNAIANARAFCPDLSIVRWDDAIHDLPWQHPEALAEVLRA